MKTHLPKVVVPFSEIFTEKAVDAPAMANAIASNPKLIQFIKNKFPPGGKNSNKNAEPILTNKELVALEYNVDPRLVEESNEYFSFDPTAEMVPPMSDKDPHFIMLVHELFSEDDVQLLSKIYDNNKILKKFNDISTLEKHMHDNGSATYFILTITGQKEVQQAIEIISEKLQKYLQDHADYNRDVNLYKSNTNVIRESGILEELHSEKETDIEIIEYRDELRAFISLEENLKDQLKELSLITGIKPVNREKIDTGVEYINEDDLQVVTDSDLDPQIISHAQHKLYLVKKEIYAYVNDNNQNDNTALDNSQRKASNIKKVKNDDGEIIATLEPTETYKKLELLKLCKKLFSELTKNLDQSPTTYKKSAHKPEFFHAMQVMKDDAGIEELNKIVAQIEENIVYPDSAEVYLEMLNNWLADNSNKIQDEINKIKNKDPITKRDLEITLENLKKTVETYKEHYKNPSYKI